MSDEVCEVPVPRLPEAPMTDVLAGLLAKGASRPLVMTLGHAPDVFLPWYKHFGFLIHEGVVDLAVKEAARSRRRRRRPPGSARWCRCTWCGRGST